MDGKMTPLHWACKRNYLDVVALLLKSGADKNVVSDKGETPASVCTNPGILQLLDTPPAFSKIITDVETLSFVPNYIKNAPLSSKLNLHSLRHTKINNTGNISSNITSNIFQEELVLKVRIANSNDPDYIEVDLPHNSLTYKNLIKVCCDELGVDASQVLKLRKLPNTKIRRDKDVQRLVNFQEIEVVLISSLNIGNEVQHKSMLYANGSTVPITPTNNYQSISKKDQTILY
ncbi:ankyrin repeat domain-containing protein 40-like isoform X2 [Phymastichus coffea]|uniref:ankyrin repeat domain-containing protein 40-like isoform X2 n=1 Tax=Phymastichus coffea TaxID=108790 RepID=UPI00273BB0DE|nr:ankyrin repeat domain-containing protein 40-like isoform X2 [Phymastichus coffea]